MWIEIRDRWCLGLRAACGVAIGVCAILLSANAFGQGANEEKRGAAEESSANEEGRSAIDEVMPRVVKVFGAGGLRGLASYGTGFLVSGKGEIVTVSSHILDADEVTVVLDDGSRGTASVVGVDPVLDIALLKTDVNEELPFFDLEAKSPEVRTGARILAFSNMYRIAIGDESVSVQQGVISAVVPVQARRGKREVNYSVPVYLIDSVVNNPGSAGGVVTSRDGKFLGMIGFELRNLQSNTWINYGLPAEQVAQAVQRIRSGKVSLPDPVTADPARKKLRPRQLGVVLIPDVLTRTPPYVEEVVHDSVAEKAGLMPNDLIVFVNDRLVESQKELLAILEGVGPNSPLRVIVRRDESLIQAELTTPAADGSP